MHLLVQSASVPRLEAVTINTHKQEWARVPEITRLFGLKRSYQYQLFAEGRIKSINLRQRGSQRGIRLVSCDSVRAFLDGIAQKEVK